MSPNNPQQSVLQNSPSHYRMLFPPRPWNSI
ncbi:hypothetical protein CP8484711_1354, partial [Chlamydia psittaci 84-8471/1]